MDKRKSTKNTNNGLQNTTQKTKDRVTVTIGAGTASPSGAPEFTPCFSGVCVTRSLVL
jgi:hypothetical protein